MEEEKQAKKQANRGSFVPGDPRINRTKPGPGQPSNAFREHWRGKFDSPEGLAYLWERAQKSDRLLIRLLEYGFGEPPKTVGVAAAGGITFEEAARILRGDIHGYPLTDEQNIVMM